MKKIRRRFPTPSSMVRGAPALVLALGTTLGTAAVPAVAQTPYPHEDEPIGTVREIYDGTLSPEMAVNTFRNIHRLFPSAVIPASTDPLPLPVASDPLEI